MLYQRTISRKLSVTGIGIHSGRKVTMVLHPASADFGIQFKRVDIPNSPVTQASYDTVSATDSATTIGEGKSAIHTIEHLMSVFYGLGINNIYCEIDGPEVPIMDGSGASFIFLLKETGITTLNESKKFIVITEKVRVDVEDKWAQISPASKLEIDSTIVFSHPVIKKQQKYFEFSCENFVKDISRARTFGFLKDVDMLKRRGLARGGSLNNAVILNDYNVINPDGIRFKDEFVRHKILDTIGDLSLLGYEIAGKIETYKSGHHLHNLLCRKLFATPSAYKIVSSANLRGEAIEAFTLPGTMSLAYH
ncbi:MAG: UDP-3-O-acyl-N-acetylglucosamine deacetylase [Bacteriovoracaceae bacterium]|nr:UDP-3-O-acyl-N-acetylglucosamine deacetylase [Bacteriovoracaceae bacterium]